MTTVEAGSEEWKKLRRRYTKPIPGKRSALYLFAAEILDLDEKIPLTPLAHWPLCLFIERATGIPEIDNATYRLIQCPRGLGKSSLATHARSVQEFCIDAQQNPDTYNRSILIFNETSRLAEKFLSRIKTSFRTNERLQTLFPEVIPDDFSDTKWTNEEIVLNRGSPRAGTPSAVSTGVGASVTGLHVDKILIDDMISEDLAENAIRGNTTEIEKMTRWLQRLKPLLNEQYRDPIDIIGTPWWAGDTYEYAERYFGDVPENATLEEAPKDEYNWTLKLPEIGGTGSGERIDVSVYKRGDLAVYRRPAIVDGRSIFPEQYTKEELHKESQKPGVSQFFHAMYHLDPTSGLDTVFDEDWLQPYNWTKPDKVIQYFDQHGKPQQAWVEEMTTFISVDAAFSDDQSAARTAIPVVGTDGEHLFLLEDFAERGMGSNDISEQVIAFALKYKPQKIFVETIGQQKALVDPIKNEARRAGIHSLPIEEVPRHSQQNKDARIWGMDRWFKNRLFYTNPSKAENFMEEYRAFPRGGAMRDVLDALSFQMDGWDQATRVHGGRDASTSEIQRQHEEAAEHVREQLT